MVEKAGTRDDVYEIYAVKYGDMPRRRGNNFLGGDPHDGPMPLDFFVWVVKSQSRTLMVDTGFSERAARARNRHLIKNPIDIVHEGLGIDPADVEGVIITHLHYDHAGNLDKLPNAVFHIQDAEMEYATGRSMTHAMVRHAYDIEDVVLLVRDVYNDRVVFHDGDAEIYPGIKVLKIGGHTKGLQSVVVNTERGAVVLASDASHYYENMVESRAFPLVHNTTDMLEGYRILYANAPEPDNVVPGHDPKVLEIYPHYRGNPDIVELHKKPIKKLEI